MINEAYKQNFETLNRAVKSGDSVLVECKDAVTGKPVMVVCAVQRVGNEFQVIPLAKLFDGDPYDELVPPSVGDGYEDQNRTVN